MVYIALKTMKGKSSQYFLQGEGTATGSAFRKRLVKEHSGVGWLKAWDGSRLSRVLRHVSRLTRMFCVKTA